MIEHDVRSGEVTDTRFSMKLLGGFDLRAADGTPIRLNLKRAKGLLAYFALEPESQQSRDKLAALLWGERQHDQVRHNLRQLLSTLRKELHTQGQSLLFIDGDNIVLDKEMISLDVAEFEHLAAQGDPESIRAAIALYRGSFLAGLDIGTPAFEEWLYHQRERLKETAIACLSKLLAIQAAEDEFEAAVLTAKRILDLDPLREDIHRYLIEIYAKHGERTLALRQYHRCAELLQRELGVQPDESIRKLYTAIHSAGASQRPELLSLAYESGPGSPAAGGQAVRSPVPAPPLLGHGQELLLMRQFLQRAKAGAGQAVALVGEAGVGKSRLIEEFLRNTNQNSLHLARAREDEDNIAYGLWAEMMRNARSAWAKAGADGTLDARTIYKAVHSLAKSESQQKPLILAFENLHWADEASLKALSTLCDHMASIPLLVLLTIRHEDMHGAPAARVLIDRLRRSPFAAVLEIAPLSRTETTALVAQELSSETAASLPEDFAGEIWRLSEGNPFVAVELLRANHSRMAAETGSACIIPDRVVAEVVARLERLDRRAQETVSAASVLGRAFDFDVWCKVAQLDGAEAVSVLERLVAASLFELDGDKVRFHRERSRAVLYSRLLPQRRRLLHRASAQAIESLYRPNLAQHFAELARHCLAAGDDGRAAYYEIQEAKIAAGSGRWDDAQVHAERGLHLLQHLDLTGDAARLRIDAGLCLADIAQSRRDFRTASALLTRLKGLLRSIGDPGYEGRVMIAEASNLYAEGHQAAAYDSARQGLKRLDSAGWGTPWVLADRLVARMHMFTGGPAMALEHLTRIADRSAEALSHRDEALAWGAVGICAALAGSTAEAERACRNSLAAAERSGDGRCLAACLQHKGQVSLWLGDARAALPDFNTALDLAHSFGDVLRFYLLHGYRGVAHLWTGDSQAAAADLKKALRLADELGTKFLLAQFTGHFAEACVVNGLADEGLHNGMRALHLARGHNQPWSESVALRVIAASFIRSDPPDAQGAARAVKAALDIQEGLRLSFEIAASRQIYEQVRGATAHRL